jgi:outer membrane protein OmpA-like peptidoglycan-associated protein
MLNNPSAKITLSGTTDPTTEKINCTLANRRSQSIKDYLINIFNIEENRILIKPPMNNCHPEYRTLSQSEFGYSENRRVEIESTSPEILAPVQGTYYLEPLKIEPAMVMYDPQGSSKEGVNRWMLTSSIFNKIITNESGKGKPKVVYYDVQPKDFRSMSATAPLSISYKVFDNRDQAALSMRNVKINRDTVDTLIERLILPLFDVSQFILESLYRNQIKEFLKILDGASTMAITGYCDFLGNDRTNEYLSEMRAREISNTVRSMMPFTKINRIEGMGATKYPLGIYSYSTPEERFLSRTVEIEIMKLRK